MTAEHMNQLIAAQSWDALESAWAEAAQEGLAADEMAGVLSAVVAAGKLDLAEMLGWTLLAERIEQLGPREATAVALAVVSAVPDSDELRSEVVGLYRRIHGDNEHFDVILAAAGLGGEQLPSRAFRTLDTCLAIRPGGYVFDRFEQRVLRVERFDPAAVEFELVDALGERLRMEPKALADDFDPVDAGDFRVLLHYRPAELAELVESDPAAVLIGLCLANGGRIDAAAVKRQLSGRHVPADKWSRWWTKARTIAKRHPNLAIEGRSPTMIAYYAAGRSLEEEMAQAASAAWTPQQRLAVLRQYARECEHRKAAVDAGFAGPLIEALAEQTRSAELAEAVAASLAIDAAGQLGLGAPDVPWPSAADLLAETPAAAVAVARLDEGDLWPGALDALARRSDAAAQLEALLAIAPADQADAICARLRQAGAADGVTRAVAAALGDPAGHLDLCLWLWRGPAEPPDNVPPRVEMLSRLLDTLGRIERDRDTDRDDRRKALHRIRAAMGAGNYAAYRQVLGEMSEAVAATFKRRIQRAEGLAETVREDMIGILRENFYSLFVPTKVEPWQDETILWTTPVGLSRREELLKEIVEVKMPANEKAIGEAAAHGDFRENSEYQSACEERVFLRTRAAALQDELAKARVLMPEDVPADVVGVGSRVLLRRLGDGNELALTFLGVWDTDLPAHVYSYKTAMAQEFMGKGIGDVVEVKLEGAQGEYRIDAISSAVPKTGDSV